MDLTKGPPLPLTQKCVEYGRDMSQSQVVTMCAFCLGSVCEECAPGHYERMGHPSVPPV
jgi:hypothetical protein